MFIYKSNSFCFPLTNDQFSLFIPSFLDSEMAKKTFDINFIFFIIYCEFVIIILCDCILLIVLMNLWTLLNVLWTTIW